MKKSIKILLASLVMIAFVIGFSAFRSANTAKKETVKTQVVKKAVATVEYVWNGSAWVPGSIASASCNGGQFKCAFSFNDQDPTYNDIEVVEPIVEANFASTGDGQEIVLPGNVHTGIIVHKRTTDL